MSGFSSVVVSIAFIKSSTEISDLFLLIALSAACLVIIHIELLENPSNFFAIVSISSWEDNNACPFFNEDKFFINKSFLESISGTSTKTFELNLRLIAGSNKLNLFVAPILITFDYFAVSIACNIVETCFKSSGSILEFLSKPKESISSIKRRQGLSVFSAIAIASSKAAFKFLDVIFI